MTRLAETLRDPDEIWLSWEYQRSLKRPVMKRTYLRQDSETMLMSAFEWSDRGWFGRTAFKIDEGADTFLRQRRGAMLYRWTEDER